MAKKKVMKKVVRKELSEQKEKAGSPAPKMDSVKPVEEAEAKIAPAKKAAGSKLDLGDLDVLADSLSGEDCPHAQKAAVLIDEVKKQISLFESSIKGKAKKVS